MYLKHFENGDICMGPNLTCIIYSSLKINGEKLTHLIIQFTHVSVKFFTLNCKIYTLICEIHRLICKIYRLKRKIYSLNCKKEECGN